MSNSYEIHQKIIRIINENKVSITETIGLLESLKTLYTIKLYNFENQFRNEPNESSTSE